MSTGRDGVSSLSTRRHAVPVARAASYAATKRCQRVSQRALGAQGGLVDVSRRLRGRGCPLDAS